MIWHDVEGGSPEWMMLRLGIPCSSEFHKIITPKTLKASTQAAGLMHRLLAEWITGEPCEGEVQTQWMVRGQELEGNARRAYSLLMDAEVTRGGFFTTEDGMIGCSPDGLIGTDGDLELKCPLIQTQVGYALKGTGAGDDYAAQLQGRLMIHEREWIDIFSYHPRLVVPPVRVYRDDKLIAALSTALGQFVYEMLEYRITLEKKYGPFVRPEPKRQTNDCGGFGVSDADVDAILAAQRERAEQWQG